jgi:hypothetical protein
MKQQTAVEWLVEQVNADCLNSVFITPDLIDKALAMEKEQIIEANEDCSTNELGEFLTGEQYYNETYKGGEQ